MKVRAYDLEHSDYLQLTRDKLFIDKNAFYILRILLAEEIDSFIQYFRELSSTDYLVKKDLSVYFFID
jgi:hypothetical protein